jgi:hypothetical protein
LRSLPRRHLLWDEVARTGGGRSRRGYPAGAAGNQPRDRQRRSSAAEGRQPTHTAGLLPAAPWWPRRGVCPGRLTRPPVIRRSRALPSPVCTAPAARQSRSRGMVTDRGECPAQHRYARWFAITNVHRLLAVSPTLTRVVCCPSAAFRWGTRSVGTPRIYGRSRGMTTSSTTDTT